MHYAASGPDFSDTSDDDRHLVERMRRTESEALRTYFDRFRPLLIREARRIGVQPALVTEMVDVCLGDVAMRLMRYTTAVPRSLAPYLVRALRLHVLQMRRGERRREHAEGGDADEADGMGRTLLSQFVRRESAGRDAPVIAYTAALRTLAADLESMMNDEERLLMLWVAEDVPQSVIAQWLGVSHGAVRNRIMRLRARLADDARFMVCLYAESERSEIAAFFRRFERGKPDTVDRASTEIPSTLGIGFPSPSSTRSTRRTTVRGA